ncbi:MAG TPA: hypothetical protein VGV61_11910 [Thermoanaerobaculia bacterium]|jgi:hypothetical protein|nr:hypothetical protein [Thermoanaerobaculia bacterium]
MTFHWLSTLITAVTGAAVAGSGSKQNLPFERDGDTVRVTAKPADGAFLVLGSASKGGSAGGGGKLAVTTGSASFPADSELTIYRLEPVGRWTPGQGGIRCDERFTDCPLPPPPIPPRDSVQALVKGLP